MSHRPVRPIVLVAVLLLTGLGTPPRAVAADGDALVKPLPAGMTTHVPIYELAFVWGVGHRVEVSGAKLIPGFAYSAPFEDLKLKP